jgi:hypothetical protein
MRQETEIDALGLGEYDGEQALLRYGGQVAALSWNDDAGEWVSESQVTIRMRDIEKMAADGTTLNTWSYMSSPYAGSGAVNCWGWTPKAILDALDAYNAGLRLQECLTWTMWSWNATSDPPNNGNQVAVVYYGFDDGEHIGPWISVDDSSPGRNVGEPIYAISGQRRWRSTGWVDSPIDAPTKQHLAPHLYHRWRGQDDDIRIDGLLTQWRWAGAPAL